MEGTSTGPILSSEMTAAVVRQAESSAEAVASHLHGIVLGPDQRVDLPVSFLLEMAAIITIETWETLGFGDQLAEVLPTSVEAKAQFAARCQNGRRAFSDARETPFYRLVLQVFVDQFAWQDRELLDAPIMIQASDDDAFIDALGEFIWANRHQLNQFIGVQDDDQA